MKLENTEFNHVKNASKQFQEMVYSKLVLGSQPIFGKGRKRIILV